MRKPWRFLKTHYAMMYNKRPYNTGQGPDNDFWKGLADLCAIFIAVSLAMLLASTLHSCKTKKVVEQTTDSTKITAMHMEQAVSDARHIEVTDNITERLVENTYILNADGDTAKSILKEKFYITKDRLIYDTLWQYNSRVDSVDRYRYINRNIITQRKLGWWEQTKIDTYNYLLIALLAILATIAIYIYYRRRQLKREQL